jgi:hypothetical protein
MGAGDRLMVVVLLWVVYFTQTLRCFELLSTQHLEATTHLNALN